MLICHQIIPQLKFSDIESGSVPCEAVEAVRRTGVAVVRGVVPKDVTEALLSDVRDYFSKHEFKGYPTDAKQKVSQLVCNLPSTDD